MKQQLNVTVKDPKCFLSFPLFLPQNVGYICNHYVAAAALTIRSSSMGIPSRKLVSETKRKKPFLERKR